MTGAGSGPESAGAAEACALCSGLKPEKTVKRSRLALLSLLLTLAVWLPVSWPLPRMFSDAISVGVSKRGDGHVTIVHMMAGDHLQFVYYLWIFSDFLTGKTPFFYNLYEFNTGDDADRFRPGSYYFPLSLLYSFFYWIDGRAFAWNAVSLLALWLACHAAWRLGRRYTDSDLVAGVGALLAVLFPYQWIQLFGGSPAGYGMALVPLMLLGLDRAVRDEAPGGGWIAGLAVLCMGMIDTHAFYFGTLAIPCWCLVAFIQRDSFAWRRVPSYLRLARSLWPVPALVLAALLQTQLGTRHISQSHAAGGRTTREVALFAPKPEGLWSWPELDPSYHIYFGFLAAAVLLAGVIVTIALALRRRDRASWRRAAVMAAVVVGTVAVVLLSMGPHGWFEGRAFNAARRFLPNYTMIRQTAKIYVLLPSLLAVGVAITLGALRDLLPRRAGIALVLAIAAGFSFEYFSQSKLLISRIDRANASYAAASADAAARGRPPRALIVPLWPGDSHYTSVYQYYASLYRIRMINGYRPFVPRDYVEDVFERWRSLNYGVARDDQLDTLLQRGIDHIILHEDLFPEKVSPFPVGVTLRNLLNHPRLALLAQDGPVWSFRILATKETRAERGQTWTAIFPARRFEAERQPMIETEKTDDPTASAGAYVKLEQGAVIRSNPLFVPPVPELRWSLRVRGKGVLACDRRVAETSIGSVEVQVDSSTWIWMDVPAGRLDDARDISFELRARDGYVDVDMAKATAGYWPQPAPGQTVSIPAPCFFHAGAIDLETDSVEFLPERDRPDLIFYGPKLPLEPGRYTVTLQVDSDAAAGTRLGRWVLACPEGEEVGRVEVLAGSPATTEITIPSNQPFLGAFLYSGNAPMRIRAVLMARAP